MSSVSKIIITVFITAVVIGVSSYAYVSTTVYQTSRERTPEIQSAAPVTTEKEKELNVRIVYDAVAGEIYPENKIFLVLSGAVEGKQLLGQAPGCEEPEIQNDSTTEKPILSVYCYTAGFGNEWRVFEDAKRRLLIVTHSDIEEVINPGAKTFRIESLREKTVLELRFDAGTKVVAE